MPPKQKQEGDRKGKSRLLSSETSVVSIVLEQPIQDSTIASGFSIEESSTPERIAQGSSTTLTPSSSPTSKIPTVVSTLTSRASTTPVNITATSAASSSSSPSTHKPHVRSKKVLKPIASSTPPTTTTTVTTTNNDPPSTPPEQPASPHILLNPPPTLSQVRSRRRKNTRDKSSTATTSNRASSSSSAFANGSERVEVKQGRICPSLRNHPALRRILGEEMPHLVPPPPLLPASGVGGWGEVLKKERATETDDEMGTATATGTGTATGTDASSSATNSAAGRRRSRFETWEEQDENEDDGDDDGYDEGTEDHDTGTGGHEESSTSASVTLSASNLTYTTYTFYLPPRVDPAYPHGFSGLISVPTPNTTTAATSTTTANATEATADGATSTDPTSKTSPSSITTNTTSSASGSDDSSEPEQSTDQSQGPPASLTNPKATAHGALAGLVAAISQYFLLSDSSLSSTGLLIGDTFVESPSDARLRQTQLTTAVGSGSCNETTAFFTTPSVTLPVSTRPSVIGGEGGDLTSATAYSEREAQRQQQDRQRNLPQELRLSMTFQVEQRADQRRHVVLKEIEVLPVLRGQSGSPATLPPSSSSQSPVSVRGHRMKRQHSRD
ncbi:hypothetical protein KI688_012878 [Linnemannia hyalina]|uniref:Uncharacterized protein n=1 Tax=Linnemannia hyalina TaxID=64524 RepID=A0A9P7XTQ7_9FUNG|nr:hypothetical protein KI688_012878 [Linnemannia hyalina]